MNVITCADCINCAPVFEHVQPGGSRKKMPVIERYFCEEPTVNCYVEGNRVPCEHFIPIDL